MRTHRTRGWACSAARPGKGESPGPWERGGGEGVWRAGPTTRPRSLFTSEAEALAPRLPPPSAYGLVRKAEGPQSRGSSGLPGSLAGLWQGRGCRE